MSINVCVMFLMLFVAVQEQSPPKVPALRILADLQHQGSLTDKVDATTPESAFAIAIPLQAETGQPIPARLESSKDDDLINRLAKCVVEAESAEQINLKLSNIPREQGVIYQRLGNQWQRLTIDESGSVKVMVAGEKRLEFAVSVVMPTRIDGKSVPQRFALKIGDPKNSQADIALSVRVAPLILPSALDPVSDVLIVDRAETRPSVDGLKALAEKAAFNLIRHESKSGDVWMQDTIEPGIFTRPSSTTPMQVHAVLTGLRREFGRGAGELDAEVQQLLSKRRMVTVQAGQPRRSRWIDWFGNLEATPPHANKQGKKFPFGRLLIGKQNELTMHPEVIRFLEAQGVQWPPIYVNTSWLMIGHVDEVVNFVPAKTPCGFKVLLPSPKAARQVLKQPIDSGKSKQMLFVGTRDQRTVGDLFSAVAQSKENQQIDEIVANIEKQLADELNLSSGDFVHLPVLFERGMAVIPNAVNSLVVNGHMIVPDPRSPKDQDNELFRDAIKLALKDCSVEVSFVNVWECYHEWAGELHCGTNTIRTLRFADWWKE